MNELMHFSYLLRTSICFIFDVKMKNAHVHYVVHVTLALKYMLIERMEDEGIEELSIYLTIYLKSH